MRFVALATLAVAVLAVRPAGAGSLLAPGDAFPAWALADQTGAQVTSKELAGKTYLVWFYPKAMTPGCTAEGRGLRDHFDAFRDKGVLVLGVSFDPPADNARFVETEHFPFRLLSDQDRALAVAVGAADSAAQKTARRISYLVGPDGRVVHVYADVDPAGHAARVLQDIL
jgi:thioredoxin-dependent peroxiredoxin